MKKFSKWYLLIIMFFLCLIIIPFTLSKYSTTIRKTITLNARQPEYDVIFKRNGLPVGYQEVEYIESTGTQKLLIDYYPKTNTKLELELSFNGTFQSYDATQKGNVIFGSTDSNHNSFILNYGSGASHNNMLFPWLDMQYGYGGTIQAFTITDAIRTNKNTIVADPKNKKITYGTVTKTIPEKTADNNSKLYLFGNASKAFGNYNMRVYKMTISEDGDIKGIYIPCYRISDGEIGLYDIENDVFYTNIGTGTFNKGNDIGTDGNVSITGTMNNQHFVYDAAQNLTANAYTRVGYSFNGWNTLPNGSGTTYTNEQLGSKLTTVDDAEVKLYAQWEPNTYNVSFHANGGTGTMNDQEIVYDVPTALSTNTFTKTGYILNSWNTESDGSGTTYTDKQVVNRLTTINNGTIDLYAQWERQTILNAVLSSSDYTEYSGTDTLAGDFSYFSGNASGKRNVVYNDICWQVIRTTDNDSVKMIYNGTATKNDDGNGNITYSCATGRGNQVGYNGGRTITANLNANYYYGTDYEYDADNDVYRLVNETATAKNFRTDYNDLLGMYTCMKTTANATCTQDEIRLVVNRSGTSGSAYVLKFVSTIPYYQIGNVPYNISQSTPASVGYMYNATYNVSNSAPSSGQIFGYGIEERTASEQEDGLGKYKIVPKYENNVEVAGSYITITDWETEYSTINSAHYTCFNTTGICDTYYFVTYTTSSTAYYVSTSSGKTISQILDHMLNDSNVNTINSVMKWSIDKWYEHNILGKSDSDNKLWSNYLDTDEIFCNDRRISNYGGWNPEGDTNNNIEFKSHYSDMTISCNTIDAFSVTSGNHELTYPVGLPTYLELYLNGSSSITGSAYYTISPNVFSGGYGASVIQIRNNSISRLGNVVWYAYGPRPTLSLKNGVYVDSGDGSASSPWVVSLKDNI